MFPSISDIDEYLNRTDFWYKYLGGAGVNDLGKVKLTIGRAMARAVFTQENPTLVVT